jgi:hypothetical protein
MTAIANWPLTLESQL